MNRNDWQDNGDNVVILHETTARAASTLLILSLAAVHGVPEPRSVRRRSGVETVLGRWPQRVADVVRSVALAAWAARP